MKIPNSKALELLEQLPLKDVANERNFLAPLLIKGRSAETSFPDSETPSVEIAKRRIAEALGQTGPTNSNNVWYQIEYNNSTGTHTVKGTLLNDSMPIKVVS
jgi:hypothetical protein